MGLTIKTVIISNKDTIDSDTRFKIVESKIKTPVTSSLIELIMSAELATRKKSYVLWR